MTQPRPTPQQFSTLIVDIDRGRLKIPQFQRDFIWPIKKSASLLDSIVKEYPIGSFIFWKTKDRLRSVRDIGGITLPEPESGDFVNYILDGQQRVTCIYAAMKGITNVKRSDGKIDDFSKIYVNFEADTDEKIITTEVEDKDVESLIKLTDLLNGGIELLNSRVPTKYHNKADRYKKSINSYIYNVIQVEDIPIETATEIFARVNLGGEELTLFEIMTAKTFDLGKNFDLAEKFRLLKSELQVIGYETISHASTLQISSLLLSKSKECKRKTILNLNKDAFIESWDAIVDALKRALDSPRDYYRVVVSKLLPYNAILVPFTYFFYHKKVRPVGYQQKLLEDFFWRVSLSGRYSSSVESKLTQDIKRIDMILDEKDPSYDWPIDSSPAYIVNNGWFSVGRSYVKAILCLYASKEPRSFRDNSLVRIDNAWLKQSNSKNYHHFFPTSFLKKKNVDVVRINNVVNITIVDDYLNKRIVRAKAPSEYMKQFQSNSYLLETMKSHLIYDLRTFGIWDDDYDAFIKNRAEAISEELKKKLIERAVDKTPQPALEDDNADEDYERFEEVS